MYQETIDSLKSLQTPTTHIKKLGVILTKTEDSKLYSLIQNTLTFLQQRHANPRIKGKSTPGDLYNNPFAPIKALIQYCEQFTKKNKLNGRYLLNATDGHRRQLHNISSGRESGLFYVSRLNPCPDWTYSVLCPFSEDT
ncbi:hypothetical protein [Hafnia alvei]|uniref:hypothetical protein n=1 Tax=Hafnia alvei TaxID=569 RepID=UPI001C5AD2A1|nr:hypothetical protein [Hafnia alvei]MBW3478436.1 hypothetical protein [Hafnia alvei]